MTAPLLPRRAVGKAGLTVTEIGFGGAPIGNFRFDISDEASHGAMAALWQGGGRLYDTSPYYGYGRSELRVGRFLQSVPASEYVLSTKIGRVMRPLRASDDTTGLRTGGLPMFPRYDYSYDGVMRSLEHSYLRMGVNRIDIALIHDVDAFTHGSDAAAEPHFKAAMDGAYKALDELRRSGDLKAIGAGINDTRWCRRFVEAGDFDCIMMAGQYTLLQHTRETLDFIELCRKRGVGLLLAAVFNSGLLVMGSKSSATFNYNPPPADVMERLRGIEKIAAAHSVPLNAAAIQFALAEPVVKAAVLGATGPAEVESNLKARHHPIPAAFWSDLKAAGLLAAGLPVPVA
ncbi:MAG TPA: aldo/keto reductase [Hyphomicrobiaceae bacterium]|nr:aldo/keto reductase [Hyphomicrobiaceae bacterium]